MTEVFDGFEDGSVDDWTVLEGQGDDIVTRSHAARGDRSLHFRDVDRSVRIRRHLPSPRRITELSFWFRYQSSNDNNWHLFLQGESTFTQIREFGRGIYVREPSDPKRNIFVADVSTNAWYRIRATNIDFDGNVYDLIVETADGDVVGTRREIPFLRDDDGWQAFDLSNYLGDDNVADPLWIDHITYEFSEGGGEMEMTDGSLDGFEDGNLDEYQSYDSRYDPDKGSDPGWKVVGNPAYRGEFAAEGDSNNVRHDLVRDLSPSQPARLQAAIQFGDFNTNSRGYVQWKDGSDQPIVGVGWRFDWDDNDGIRWLNTRGQTLVSQSALTIGSWYLIELRNINYVAGSADVYVDGNQVAGNVSFGNAGEGTEIERVHLNVDAKENHQVWLDDITVGPGADPTTATPKSTATSTATPTATATPSPTDTRTPTVAATPEYDIRAGDATRVDVGYDELLVITDIPDTESGRIAVTDNQYRLVDLPSTYDALVARSYQQKGYVGDLYRREIQHSTDRINKWYVQELLTRLGNFVLNVDAMLKLGKLGTSDRAANPPQAIDAVVSLADWGRDIADQPYKKRFRSVATACQNYKWIDTAARSHSIDGYGEQLRSMVTDAATGYREYTTGGNLDAAWEIVITAAENPASPMFTTGSAVTASEKTGVFVKKAVASYAYEQAGAWLKTNARIGGMMTAYHTVRREIFRKLVALEEAADDGGLSPGQAVRYETYLYTIETLSAMAHDHAAQGYDELASLSSAPVWNFIMDADSLSDVHRGIADAAEENRRRTFLSIGAFHEEGRRANESINSAVLQSEVEF